MDTQITAKKDILTSTMFTLRLRSADDVTIDYAMRSNNEEGMWEVMF